MNRSRLLCVPALALALAALSSGCPVPVVGPGKACDLEHPCSGARICSEGVCIDVGQPCAASEAGKVCVAGKGICAREGVTTCLDGFLGCSAQPGAPEEEICDGRDNDCDGEVDSPLVAPACPLTQGVCAAAVQTCNGPAGWSGSCEYGPDYEPASETRCDNRDNDCDGVVDNVPGCLRTLAGSGPPGFSDGEGPGAAFARPGRMTADSAGNVYVVDGLNHAIRKITPGGTVSTVAGTGRCGFSDGPAATAQLCRPGDVEVAGDGTVYFTDTYNQRLRKVSQGQVTTVAGGNGNGWVDGVGDDARFTLPNGLSFEANGDLLIADDQNFRIRRFNPATRAVTTVAGNGTGTFSDSTNWLQVGFSNPADVVMTSDGSLVVMETFGSRIRRLPPTGSSQMLAEYPDISGPSQLAWSEADGRLYFSDGWNQRMRGLTLGGTLSNVVGAQFGNGFSNGLPDDARIFFLAGFARVGSTFYLTDINNVVRKAVFTGNFNTSSVTDFAGAKASERATNGAATTARLYRPFGLTRRPDGSLVWIEEQSGAIRQLGADGNVTTLVGNPTATGGADFNNGPFTAASFRTPEDLAAGPDGSVYVTEAGNNSIRRLDFNSRTVSTFSGPVNSDGVTHRDGTLSEARYNHPKLLAVGKASGGGDALYLYDESNIIVRKIALPSGPVSTFAGTLGVGSSTPADGAPGTATFNIIRAMAVDGTGNIYVSDNGHLRRIDSSGTVTTFSYTDQIGYINGLAIHGNTLFLTESRRVVSFQLPIADPTQPTELISVEEGWTDGQADAAAMAFGKLIALPKVLLIVDPDVGRIRQLGR